ncbi:Ku protein [Streptomyces sp. NPDC002215]|uniref:non-homologous end joining protein Ku n=1 Tax=Streptomyces sp. NPDC002215 TaxID=3154412 RepID=UPI0033225422
MNGKVPARSVWKGVFSFGMVVLPARLYSATEEHKARLREVHSVDSGRIRHKRVCELEGGGEEVPHENVGRAFELPDGRLVLLTDEDLDHLPLPTRHVAEVLGFVPGTDIDPISYGRAYYAAPDGPAADRPYVLLTEVLARTGYVGLCKIAIGRRERLAVLRPRHGVLVCQTLLWQDELRDPGDLAPSTPVTDQELQLAETLLSELTGIEMRELHDEYGRALEQLVDAKVAGGQVETLPVPQPAADLLAALEESVRAARTSRSGEAD